MDIQQTVYTVNPVTPILLTQEENSQFIAMTEVFLDRYLCKYTYDQQTKRDFAPLVVTRIKIIVHSWLQKLKGNNSFSKTLNNLVSLTFPENQHFVSVLSKIYKISVNFCCRNHPNNTSDLIGSDIKVENNDKVTSYSIELRWSPKNRFLYPDTGCQMPAPLLPNKLFRSFVQAELNYLRGETNQDFILIVEGQQIPVHTHRLAIHSEYFATLFKGDFKEAKTGKIEIPNHKLHIVLEMLDYIYTGSINKKITSSIVDLIALANIADMYQVKSLVFLLESKLSVHAIDHFEKVFELALRLDFEHLLEYCLKLGEDKKECLSILPKYVTRDNIAKLYTLAFESKFKVIEEVLDNCRKYNPVLSDIDIQIEK